MKKKLAIIIDNINAIGGTQTFSKNLKKILQNKFKVDIISLLSNGKQKRILYLGLKKNVSLLIFGFYVLYKLKKYDYCIVVSGQTINYFLIWGHGKKYIYRESNLPIDRIQKQGLFKKIIQKILYKVFININKKSKFIAPSIPVYKQLLKIGVKKKRLFLLQNPMPPKNLELKSLNKRNFNLVFSGRPTYTKGFDRIIKYTNNDIIINYFGPKLKNSNNNIIYEGLYQNKSNALFESKIVIIPSRFEGYPNIFLEALNSGCFVILSDELKWLLNDKILNFVYVIKKNNVEDLKKKLILINQKIKFDNQKKLSNRIKIARKHLMTFEKYYKKINILLQ